MVGTKVWRSPCCNKGVKWSNISQSYKCIYCFKSFNRYELLNLHWKKKRKVPHPEVTFND